MCTMYYYTECGPSEFNCFGLRCLPLTIFCNGNPDCPLPDGRAFDESMEICGGNIFCYFMYLLKWNWKDTFWLKY